ncbi:MAG: nucleotidyltransferase domain-containing protein [Desulfurococcales archaeon]|nr:nucleotidyltransferase domain-containing protein [Desulfurococcales archaeon]
MVIEGFYIETSSLIYAVKGVCDYGDFIPVVPKYLKTGCEKVRNIFTQCPIEYLPSIGIRACVVNKEDISIVYNPFEYSNIRLPSKINSFIKMIEKTIGYAEVGITGSYLLGCPRDGSDIDLIIHGKLLRDEYAIMRDVLGGLRKCNGSLVEKNYIEKISADNSMDLSNYREIFKDKILEGCYENKLYSIRIVEEDAANIVCRNTYYYKDHIVIVGRLIHVKPYTTPAIYIIQNDEPDYSYNVMTWRIRYTELPEGFYLIEGESFVDSAGGSWIIPDHGGRIKKLRNISRKFIARQSR